MAAPLSSSSLRIAVLCLLFALLISPQPAAGQYMFIDTDGDGVSGFEPASGVLDVYLVTNRTIQGGPAGCPTDGSELGFSSYMVNLYVVGPAVTFSNVQNEVTGMTQTVPLTSSPYSLSVGFGGSEVLPSGKYKLLHMDVTGESGCQAIEIVASSCYSPPGVVTSFGTNCPGVRGDRISRMGEDWFYALGTAGCTDLTGRRPSVLCPGLVEGAEGHMITFSASVVDPDCAIPGFSVSSVPPGAVVSDLSPFVQGEAHRTVTWTSASGQAGTYSMQFQAYDPDPFNTYIDPYVSCTTQIIIHPTFGARVLTTTSNRTIRLGSGKPTWCAQVEPVGGDFTLSDAVFSSFVLKFGGNQIPALAGKAPVSSDTDGNGLDEIGVCFSKENLRSLFAGLPNGRSTVTVGVEGTLVSGGKFSGSTQVDVIPGGRGLTATLSPNPFNPEAVLTLTTDMPGPLLVRLYDTAGRLVRTLADIAAVPAGSHEVHVDGRSENGRRLSSGIYLYRVEAAEGEVTGRLVILK